MVLLPLIEFDLSSNDDLDLDLLFNICPGCIMFENAPKDLNSFAVKVECRFFELIINSFLSSLFTGESVLSEIFFLKVPRTLSLANKLRPILLNFFGGDILVFLSSIFIAGVRILLANNILKLKDF